MLSPGAILVCLVLAAIVTAILVRGIRNLRRGGSSCSCGGSCGSCGGCGGCAHGGGDRPAGRT